jgi:hypothetical protein
LVIDITELILSNWLNILQRELSRRMMITIVTSHSLVRWKLATYLPD